MFATRLPFLDGVILADVATVTEPMLCGIGTAGRELSHETCATLLKLDVVARIGGTKWETDEGESYRGRTWRGGTASDDARPALRNRELDAFRDHALGSTRQRLAREHDATLQVELARLRQWAEDEETALRDKLDALRRRIADAARRAKCRFWDEETLLSGRSIINSLQGAVFMQQHQKQHLVANL